MKNEAIEKLEKDLMACAQSDRENYNAMRDRVIEEISEKLEGK